MSENSLQSVAETLERRAQRQGYVLARDIRKELKMAGLDEGQWHDVLPLIQPPLYLRQGRYYHADTPVSPRLEKEQKQQRQVEKIIARLLREHRASNKRKERRAQVRVDFIQPVKVRTEDGREFTLLSRDLSGTGVRLLGTKRLLGQKVHLQFPGENDEPWLLTRILWTCAITDDLFENGGNFLEITRFK